MEGLLAPINSAVKPALMRLKPLSLLDPWDRRCARATLPDEHTRLFSIGAKFAVHGITLPDVGVRFASLAATLRQCNSYRSQRPGVSAPWASRIWSRTGSGSSKLQSLVTVCLNVPLTRLSRSAISSAVHATKVCASALGCLLRHDQKRGRGRDDTFTGGGTSTTIGFRRCSSRRSRSRCGTSPLYITARPLLDDAVCIAACLTARATLSDASAASSLET